MTLSAFKTYKWCDLSGNWHTGYPKDLSNCLQIKSCEPYSTTLNDCTPAVCYENDPTSPDGQAILDGIVQGTAGGDVIDLAYTGDPQGDRIDNDDQFLAGEGVNDDIVQTLSGNDVVDGGADNDEIFGGRGNDVIWGKAGNDVIYGDTAGQTLGTSAPRESFEWSKAADQFNDGSIMTFAEIENVIPCFTPSTMIATPQGERSVEDLQVGDRIITRDNGIQPIAWVGRKVMSGTKLAANPHLKPILIKAGALGAGLPERDMLVSPNHRVLVASDKTQLYFEEREVLAAAKHMVGVKGIHALNVMSTTYIHFMFERHEVVLSNGAWTESFQPGDYSMKGLGNSQRNEIYELFPELATQTGRESYQSARKSLKKNEARLLFR